MNKKNRHFQAAAAEGVCTTARVIQSEKYNEGILGCMQAEICLDCALECRQREDGGVYVPVWQS